MATRKKRPVKTSNKAKVTVPAAMKAAVEEAVQKAFSRAIKALVPTVWPPSRYRILPFAEAFGGLITRHNWPPQPPQFQPQSERQYFDLVAQVMARLFWNVGTKSNATPPPLPQGQFYVDLVNLISNAQLANKWPAAGQKFNLTAWDVERALDLMLQAVNKALGGGGSNQQLPPD